MKTFREFLAEAKQIGKATPEARYVHRSSAEATAPDSEFFNFAQSKLPAEVKKRWTIAKFVKDGSAIAFIESPDWDSADEPTVGDAYRVDRQGNVKVTKGKADPQIYHHKHEFVAPDYKGFDVVASKKRSELWKSLPGAKDKQHLSRIGTKSYWDKHFIPAINAGVNHQKN